MSTPAKAPFAQGTRRLFAIAAQTLGWRPAEFWEATPSELASALHPIGETGAQAPPSAETIAQMMERDDHG